jgi:hypothetical protein
MIWEKILRNLNYGQKKRVGPLSIDIPTPFDMIDYLIALSEDLNFTSNSDSIILNYRGVQTLS